MLKSVYLALMDLYKALKQDSFVCFFLIPTKPRHVTLSLVKMVAFRQFSMM